MNKKLTLSKLNIFIATAAILLVVGLAVDGMITKPQLQEIMILEEEKARLYAEIEHQRMVESDSRAVADLLDVESLIDLETTSHGDPIAYISNLLDESKLVRLGLTTSDHKDVGSLRKNSFTLRAKGGYRDMQDFVQRIENGSRLASIDAFKIRPTIDGLGLEGRFNLSIYDVKEER